MTVINPLILIMICTFLSCEGEKSISENRNYQQEPRNNSRMVSKYVCSARLDDQWMFLNTSGENIFDKTFTYAGNFSEAKACINSGGIRVENPDGVAGGSFRFIDLSGEDQNIDLPVPSHYYEQVAIVELEDGMALMDHSGNILTSAWSSILSFREAYTVGTKGGSTYILKNDGVILAEVDPAVSIDAFSDGLARAMYQGKAGYMNISGQWEIDPQFDNASPFSENRAYVYKDGELYFINLEGHRVSELEIDYCGTYKNGYAGIQVNGAWGFINLSGKMAIVPKYTQLRSFSESLAAVKDDDGVSYIDTSGQIVLSTPYESAYDFVNGYAIFQLNGKLGMMDTKGNVILKPIYDRLNPFVDPRASNEEIRIH